jgi:hypothetical protein
MRLKLKRLEAELAAMHESSLTRTREGAQLFRCGAPSADVETPSGQFARQEDNDDDDDDDERKRAQPEPGSAQLSSQHPANDVDEILGDEDDEAMPVGEAGSHLLRALQVMSKKRRSASRYGRR